MNGLCVDKPRQSYTAGKFPLPQWRSRPPEAGVRRTQSPPRASTPHKRFKVSINSDGSGKTWPSGATYNVVDKVLISVEHPHLSQSQFAAEPDESGDHMLQNKKEAVKSIINQDNGVAWEKITIIFAHLATAATFFAAGHSVLEDAFLPPSPNKLAGKFGAFFILYSVFVEDREMAVALTYLVGMTGTCTEFFRMYTFQQSFSGFLACITLTSASLYVINSVILDRRILRTRLWRSWRGFGAILGYILVPQLSVALLKETSQMLEPRSVALHAGLLGAFFGVVAQLMLKKKGIRQDLGAWSATVIFMLLSVDDMVSDYLVVTNLIFFLLR
jgi:hypothetical protein